MDPHNGVKTTWTGSFSQKTFVPQKSLLPFPDYRATLVTSLKKGINKKLRKGGKNPNQINGSKDPFNSMGPGVKFPWNALEITPCFIPTQPGEEALIRTATGPLPRGTQMRPNPRSFP